MLLALAHRAKQVQLNWQAGLAATRARDLSRARTEAYAHHVEAELCLVTAVRAAALPPGFRLAGVALPKDPITAMVRLRDQGVAVDWNNRIEAEHELARITYRQEFAAPLSAAEQAQAQALAALKPARRDKVIEMAEALSR